MAIAPIKVEECIRKLRAKADDINYCEIEGLLTWSAKYLEYQQKLLRELYEAGHELDYEYCGVLHNYQLEPFDKKTPTYRVPRKYDDVWMQKFIDVENFLEIK